METKPWYFSKTIWFNIISFIAALFEMTEITNVVPAEHKGTLAAIVAAVNLGLRMMTSDPLTKSAAVKAMNNKLPILLLAAGMLTACASAPQTRNEQIAEYGLKAAQLTKASQDVVFKVYETKRPDGSPMISQENMRKIQETYVTAGDAFTRLGTLLQAIDAGTQVDPTSSQVEKTMNEIQLYTQQIIALMGDSAMNSEVLKLFSEVNKTFFTIQSGIAAIKEQN